MGRYLLDTNHISPLITRDHALLSLVLTRVEQGDEFYICIPALSEFFFGIYSLPRAKDNQYRWQKIEHRFDYIALDKQDAERAAQLRLDLRRKGWQLGLVDALLAVVALRYELTLLTTDKDFTAVPHLPQENWR